MAALSAGILILIPVFSPAQDKGSVFLPFIVEKGDTVFMDTMPPSYSWASLNKKDWKRYKRLVEDFAVVYPYSRLARELVEETDRTFRTGNLTKLQKEKYVNDLQGRIVSSYEKTAMSLHLSQGLLLMRLIDRETGQSAYELVRDYKSGLAAGFWQGMAKVFGVSMKKHYDPQGADKDTEALIQVWDSGGFPELYRSMFGEYPVIPEVPDNIKAFLRGGKSGN